MAACATVCTGHGSGYVDVVGRDHPIAQGEVRCTSAEGDEARIEALREEIASVGFETVVVEPTPARTRRRRWDPDWRAIQRNPQMIGCLRCKGPAVVIPIPPDFEQAPTFCPECTVRQLAEAEHA